MSQQKKDGYTLANAWAEPLSLVHRRAGRAAQIQPSSKEDDTRSVMKPDELRINKKQEAESQADKSPQPPAEIDIEAIASRVYRLMRTDLVLEKERMSKSGG
jgi:hypothetical protein